MNDKSQVPTCSRCGAPLSSDALKGLCPRCLMELNLSAPTEIPGEAGPHGTKVFKPLPTVEEIAKHFPQFEILECLGRGGMGVVYKARQPKLNRLVALKILAPEREADPKFAERFQREAQALARLNHPNIVTVYDFGETDGLYYLTMEFADGVSLRRLLETRKMEPEKALAIVPKICEALQYAHDEGVVHRDIKPENILLDRKGRVKIADFGIAKIMSGEGAAGSPLPAEGLQAEAGAQATSPSTGGFTQGQILGTPDYMAPEQKEHPQKVDHRADIYSLGVVFYEMLTGELPIGKFQPPSRKVQVDVRLDEVVLHTLEREPERRYQQASQVKTAVETIAQTPAPPPADRAGLETVRRQVAGPAICLFILGSLNLGLLLTLLGCTLSAARSDGGTRGFVFVVLVPVLIAFVGYGLTIVGAAQMKCLGSYGLALSAAICAMIFPPGCVLGLPIGIWALIVLSQRDVRHAFGKARRLATGPSLGGARAGKRAGLAVAVAGALVVFLGVGVWLGMLARVGSGGSALPPGVVAWWPLEGHAGDVVSGDNGALQGSFVFVPAEVGRGIRLEGPRSGISVSDRPGLNFGPDQDFSIEAWIQPGYSDTEFGVMDIVDKRDAPDLLHSHGYAMAVRNGKLCFLMADSLEGSHLNWEQQGPDLRDGLWHHVAVTVLRASPAGVNLYVDGQVIATFDPTPARGDLGTQQPLLIGMHPSYPWFQGNFRGGIDEVSVYRRALSREEIVRVYDAGTKGKRPPRRGFANRLAQEHAAPAAALTPSGLVSLWKGEAATGDSMGVNIGVPHGGVTYVEGRVGRAFRFDGTNSYVEVPDAPCLRLTNALTIEFWVKRQQVDWPTDYLLNKGGDWTRGRLNYGVVIAGPEYDHHLAFMFAGGNRHSVSIADLDWHHVAVVARQGEKDPAFYLDGKSQPVIRREGVPAIDLFPSPGPLHIGAQVDPSSGWSYFSKAVVDEMSIYNRPLGAGEIQAIYYAGSSGKRSAVKNAQARAAALPETSVDLGGGVRMEFVLIRQGSFMMGTKEGVPGQFGDEKPARQVRITRPFFLGKWEVTQEQWDAVMENNPSQFKGPKLPVENVSWEDAQSFLDKLEAKTGRKFALPTEAQWEYACRAGTITRYCFGDNDANLGDYAWYEDNSDGTSHEVGQKRPNGWGLYDMHGNVWEWCADGYDPYPGNKLSPPQGPPVGTLHVLRGGGWTSPSNGLRSSNRNSDWRGFTRVGLRCVMPAEEPGTTVGGRR